MTRNRTAVDVIADDFSLSWAALSPLLATEAGIAGFDHLIDDLSPDGHEATADLFRRTLARLDAVDPADETDEVTIAAMRDRLGLALENHEASEDLASLNVIASPLQALRDVPHQSGFPGDIDWPANPLGAAMKGAHDATTN